MHETEFTCDAVFGYHHSYLPLYVEQKTGRRIRADQVERFTLTELRSGCLERLMGLSANVCCAVDAERQQDLDRFAVDLHAAAGEGKRFLFRSATTMLTALAKLSPQPVPPTQMAAYVRGDKPGAVIVSLCVAKTTAQLERLLHCEGVAPIEVDVNRLPAEHESLVAPVQQGRHHRQRRALHRPCAALRPRGGSDPGGLLGGALPGRPPPDLPVVIFPGNVGDEDALATVYSRLARLDIRAAV